MVRYVEGVVIGRCGHWKVWSLPFRYSGGGLLSMKGLATVYVSFQDYSNIHVRLTSSIFSTAIETMACY